MDKITQVVFKDGIKEAYGYGLWQWNYGQVLRIQGLSLPTAAEIHFSLQERNGESVTRIGITKDGVTDVVIPDSMLENEGVYGSEYNIYAFVYLTDEESGRTEYKMTLEVKTRPKPEAFDTPEDAELFREAIAAVNECAKRAEESGKLSEAWAHGHEEYPEMDEDNAKYYAEQAKKASSEVSEDAKKKIDEYVEQKKEALKGEPGEPGDNGITPHVGGNGHWWIGDNDTGVIATGADGKSAYEYAVEGGYKGTEEEFTQKLSVEYPTDVQIKGTSIVGENGVAEIPYATASRFGAVRLQDYNEGGLAIDGMVRLVVYPAQLTDIDRRTQNLRPIISRNLDYAVKAAMCDGKGEAWTDEEQAAARARMGTIGDWEQLIDVTTEEDASSFSFTFKDVEELIVMISGTATNERVNFYSTGITSFYPYNFLNANKLCTNCIYVGKRLGGMRCIDTYFPVSETPDISNSYALLNLANRLGTIVRSIDDTINNLSFNINSTETLRSGARIQIFGR